jgi:GntR family transcriptional repressor for pyruvate dehydrogenase complex
MKVQLKPIKPKRISDQVFDQLRELIFRGDIGPGQKLMPERELSENLGVSRSSVREAINKLVTLGFLEQRQGHGTIVRSLDEAGMMMPLATVMEAQDASLIDLLEVRRGMESNAAAMAAQRADEKDVRLMEKGLRSMEEETAKGGLGTEGDVGFHMAISYATKNPLQVYIMKTVFDFLFVGIRENLLHLYEDPRNIEEILRQHTAIFEAVRSRNPDAAFNAMRRHIDFVISFFKRLEN